MVKCGTALSGDLIFEDVHQVRHPAEHVGWGGDHARPDRALFLKAVERTRVVVEALGKKLKLLPLDEATAVYPGHGDNTTIAASKREHAAFASRPHAADLHGDVTWEG